MLKNKKILYLFLYIGFCSFAQKSNIPFKNGEFLKYKLSYGLLNAGFLTLDMQTHLHNQEELLHVNGKGWTTGMVNLFFSVDDNYQTYFNPKTMQPYRFIRKIEEGGYIKNKEIYFDFKSYQAKVIDYKHHTEKYFEIKKDVQDMLSSLYYLRTLDFNYLYVNDIITFNMFFDSQTNLIKLRLIKRDVINTKFGKVKTVVFKPMVQEGRVFKDKETVTIWITDDLNKIPVKIKASILVGSIKAELIEYKGLVNSFPIIFN